jgi:hypothetical protein
MEMLRGERPGAPARTMRVIPGTRAMSSETVEFSLYDAQVNNSYRLQARANQFHRLRVGNVVTVRCLDDDRECFFYDSVYVDDGNMGFDHSLRVVEFAGIAAALMWITIALWRWRSGCLAADAVNRRVV